MLSFTDMDSIACLSDEDAIDSASILEANGCGLQSTTAAPKECRWQEKEARRKRDEGDPAGPSQVGGRSVGSPNQPTQCQNEAKRDNHRDHDRRGDQSKGCPEGFVQWVEEQATRAYGGDESDEHERPKRPAALRPKRQAALRLTFHQCRVGGSRRSGNQDHGKNQGDRHEKREEDVAEAGSQKQLWGQAGDDAKIGRQVRVLQSEQEDRRPWDHDEGRGCRERSGDRGDGLGDFAGTPWAFGCPRLLLGFGLRFPRAFHQRPHPIVTV